MYKQAGIKKTADTFNMCENGKSTVYGKRKFNFLSWYNEIGSLVDHPWSPVKLQLTLKEFEASRISLDFGNTGIIKLVKMNNINAKIMPNTLGQNRVGAEFRILHAAPIYSMVPYGL